MQIYNPTNSQLTIPIGGQYITVPAEGVSNNILGTPELINLVIGSFKPSEIAFIVSGPQELNLVANMVGVSEYVVQTLDEAIQRFQKKD